MRRALLPLLLLALLPGCSPAAPHAGASPSAAATSAPATTPPSRPSARASVVALGHSPASTAWSLALSRASSTVVQPQPPAGSCHARGGGLFALPDPRCTPGVLNPAVTQRTIGSTICVSGWTKTVRPSYDITHPEKLASMQAYGDPPDTGAYEYDHLVSLELGGAPNDARNLWPEPGGSPNPKDSLENRLHAMVCDGQLTLAAAQRAIAVDWVSAYRRYVGATTSSSTATTSAPAPATGGSCRAGVSDPTPSRGGDETVTVTTRPGVSVTTQAHYKTTTTEHDGVADGSGVARITFSIGHPTAGYTVVVDVSTGAGQTCRTSFTPQ